MEITSKNSGTLVVQEAPVGRWLCRLLKLFQRKSKGMSNTARKSKGTTSAVRKSKRTFTATRKSKIRKTKGTAMARAAVTWMEQSDSSGRFKEMASTIVGNYKNLLVAQAWVL